MADPMYALEKAKREQIREDLRRAARERAALRARVEDADNAIRELVVAGRDAGLSVQECADAIGVSRSALYKARHIRGPKDQEAKG